MSYHPLVKKIVSLIESAGYWHETFEHAPVRTSEEAAQIRDGYTLSEGAKALIIRVKKSGQEKKFVMLVVPGDKKFDKAKVQKVLSAKDLRFATEEEVIEVTGGVQPGGVPPFGNLFNLEVFADKEIFEKEKIIFNAGDKSFSVAMKADDYYLLVRPIKADIV